MINETAFPHPQPSFPFPVDLIETEPGAEPLVCVKFNAHYLPYILGALLQLALRSTWDADTDSDAQNQLLRVNDLIYLFQKASDDCGASQSHIYEELDTMPAFRVDCDCNVFVLCCDGTEVQLAKLSDVPKSSSPSNTNPQPSGGGGTAKYCQTMSAQGKLLIPTLVNSGDVITLLSASGAGNDGSEAAWRCVDGSQFFAGACVGFPHTDGGDPVPTANHMSLIVNVDGTFYAFTSGSLTVPSGVVNAQAFIQVNDAALLGNFGSYDICVQVTNNQAIVTSWSHTFDFKVTPGGFVPSGSHTIAHWESGTGWVSGLFMSGSTPQQFDDIKHLISPAAKISGGVVTYLIPAHTGGASSIQFNDSEAFPSLDNAPGLHVNYSITLSSDDANYVEILIEMNLATDSTIISSLTLFGTGENPFV